MEKRTKTILIVGLFIIAAIIAFALYRGFGAAKDTTVTTGGGSTTTTKEGLGKFIVGLFT